MSVEVIIYDAYSNLYTREQFVRLMHVANTAARDGYHVTFDEYQGQALAWAKVEDDGEAAIFKLKYL